MALPSMPSAPALGQQGFGFAEPDRKVEELRNLHRIIELTTYNLVSLRTQCPDDARVKAEIKTLENKLDKLIFKQVVIKHEAEEQGLIAAELNDFPDTSLWLRKMDLERYEQTFASHHVTCDYLLRLDDAQVPNMLRHELKIDRSNADKVAAWLKSIKGLVQSGGTESAMSLTQMSLSRTPQFLERLAHSASATPEDLSPLSRDTTEGLDPVGMTTQRRISHSIHHRFQSKFVLPAMCNYCRKIMVSGMICRECKFVCHAKCAKLVAPTCGLPPEYEEYFKSLITVSLVNDPGNRRTFSADQLHKIVEGSPGSGLEGSHSSYGRGGLARRRTAHDGLERMGSTVGHGSREYLRAASETGMTPSSSFRESRERSLSRQSSAEMGFGPSVAQQFVLDRETRGDRPHSRDTTPRGSLTHSHHQRELLRASSSEYGIPTVASALPGHLASTPSKQDKMPRPASTSALPATMPPRSYNRSISGSNVTGISQGAGSGNLASPTGGGHDSVPVSRRRGVSMSVASSSPPLLDAAQKPPQRRKSVDPATSAGAAQSPWIRPGRPRGATLGTNSPRTHRQGSVSVTASPLAGSPRGLRGSRTMTSIVVPNSPSLRGTFFGMRDKSDLADWEIPYEELTFVKKLSGDADEGEVHHGKWHGDVAIKMWNVENPTEEMLRAFRREVSTLRKLRHQNILLFMGAVVSPPHFAIVTKFCNGCTLYRHIHVNETKFELEHVLDIVTQLTQGMEYLHARRIVKRKLTTKSVFVETDGKVMIGDFSLATMSNMPIDVGTPASSPNLHGRRRHTRPMANPMSPTSPLSSPKLPHSPTTPVTPHGHGDLLLPVPSSGQLAISPEFQASAPPPPLLSVQTVPASLTAYQQTHFFGAGSGLPNVPSSLTATPVESAAVSLNKIAPIRYLAPEILATSSAQAFTFKSDVYAFGIVVYELLAMSNPYPRLMPEQVVMAVCTNREKPNMDDIRKDWPAALKDMVSSCLDYLPQDRPSFEDIVRMLQSSSSQLSLARAPSLPLGNLPPRRDSA